MEFDEVVWRARAWERLKRAVRAKRRESIAYKRWLDDVKYIEALRVVVEWCRARTLTVTFCKKAGGMYYTADKEIKISGRASPARQLHLLLHECGHCLIGSKEKDERFGMGYGRHDDPKVNRTAHHRLDILEEEFEAWHRGWKLALRLGALTEADKEAYDKTRTRLLYTYVQWTSKQPGFESYENPAGNAHEKPRPART